MGCKIVIVLKCSFINSHREIAADISSGTLVVTERGYRVSDACSQTVLRFIIFVISTSPCKNILCLSLTPTDCSKNILNEETIFSHMYY